jgi:hypothetical protein
MNKVVFQLWEELERGENIKNDGCSLHINSTERDIFVKSFYEKRNNSIPDEYEKSSGSFIEAFIDDLLYDKLLKNKSLRLSENSMRNLISMSELIIKDI